MKILIFLILALLGLVLQSTLFSHWPSSLIRFDLPFILVIYWALFEESIEVGLFVTLLIGIMTDALGTTYLGQSTLVYSLIYILFCLIRKHIYLETTLSVLMTLAILALVKETLFWVEIAWLHEGLPGGMKLILQLLGSVFWTVFISHFLFMPLKWLMPSPQQGRL